MSCYFRAAERKTVHLHTLCGHFRDGVIYLADVMARACPSVQRFCWFSSDRLLTQHAIEYVLQFQFQLRVQIRCVVVATAGRFCFILHMFARPILTAS